jgi:glycosyltransferase involved in cell wall biosynthesis
LPTARLLIVGEAEPPAQWQDEIRDRRLEGAVTIAGRVPDREFLDYLEAADLCVHLRQPSAGETSRTLLRLLAAGKPTIVSSAGACLELPDSTCLKLPPGEDEADLLCDQICALAADARRRGRLAESARRWHAATYRPAATARAYVHFLEAVAGRSQPEPGPRTLTALAAELLAESFLELDGDDLSDRLRREILRPALELGSDL